MKKYIRSALLTPWFGYFFFLFFVSFFLLNAFLWIEHRFGAVSVEAALFTLNNSLEGVADVLYRTFIRIAVQKSLIFSFIASVLSCMAVFQLPKFRRLIRVLPLATLLITVTFLGIKFDLFRYIERRNTESLLVQEEYRRTTIDDMRKTANKNVILLVMESMENTFHLHEENRLIPLLRQLQEENVYFPGHHDVPGTSFTAGGLTAYLLGLHLSVPLTEEKNMSFFSKFLPSSCSILQIFEACGYDISLVQGTTSRFGGVFNLFKTHAPSATIFDSHYFDDLPGSDAFTGRDWGYRDTYVYAFARETLARQASTGKPFFTVIVTIDTHTPAVSYQDYETPYGDERDSFVAADQMAHEFVAWLKKQDFYENTVLVVLGDHPYMGKRLGTWELPVQRPVFNCFINAHIPVRQAYLEREFLSMDLAPTILESAGFEWDSRRLGLGVSLFSDEPTLVEKYGYRHVLEQLGMHSTFYYSLFR